MCYCYERRTITEDSYRQPAWQKETFPGPNAILDFRSDFLLQNYHKQGFPCQIWRSISWHNKNFSVEPINSFCFSSRFTVWGLVNMCRFLESIPWSFVNLKRVWICLSLHTKHLYSYNLRSTSIEAQHWHFWPKSLVEFLLQQTTFCFN